MKDQEHHSPDQLDLFRDVSAVGVAASTPPQELEGDIESTSVKAPASPASSLEATLPGVKKNSPKALAEALHRELESATGCTIILAITNNTSNMMSVVLDSGGITAKLRLHHMFLDAPREVRAALAYWIKHPKSRKYADCFRNFIVSRNHQIRKSVASPSRIHTQGVVHDLRAIYDELNAAYFDSSVDAAITWGRETSGPMRSIRFGSYYEATRLIRIHPRLDQTFVPFFMIRYIVYHEMLHAYLGVFRNANGRRQIHPRRFKAIETAFPDYQRAVAWIETPGNLNKLLRTRRSRRGT